MRLVLGIVAGVLIVLSGVAHSVMGGQGIGEQMAAAKVPADLAQGLMVGWHFGGAAMVAFGVIVGILFYRRMRDKDVRMMPVVVIAVTYLAFGLWALVSSGFNPFFAVFLGPGALILAATPWDSL